MRKDRVYELYSKLDIDKDAILGSLPVIMYLNDIEEDMFYKLCINNKDKIDSDIYDSIIKILYLMKDFYFISSKEQVYEILNEIFENDVLMSYDESSLLFDNMQRMFEYTLIDVFELTLSESEEYIVELMRKYVDIFKRISKFPVDKVYDHDYQFISDAYMEEVEFLCDTEVDTDEDLISNCMKKLDLFSNLLVDSYELEPLKYRSTILTGEKFNNIHKLSRYVKSMRFVDKSLDVDSHMRVIENYSDELNSNTLDMIQKQLGIEIAMDSSGKFNVIRPKKSKVNHKKQDEILRNILIYKEDKENL